MTIRLYLEYPPNYARQFGMNSLYAGRHWSVRKRDAEYWHAVVRAELARQHIPRAPLPYPVEITFRWRDRCDLSNEAYAAKMIEDGLKGWVIEDDGTKYVKAIHHIAGDVMAIVVEIRRWNG